MKVKEQVSIVVLSIVAIAGSLIGDGLPTRAKSVAAGESRRVSAGDLRRWLAGRQDLQRTRSGAGPAESLWAIDERIDDAEDDLMHRFAPSIAREVLASMPGAGEKPADLIARNR